MSRRRAFAFALALALTWLLPLLCPQATRAESYHYREPEKINDGWEAGSLATEGIDVAVVSQMVEAIRSGDYRHVQSVVIAKNGRLVLEEYFPRDEGVARERALGRMSPQEQASVTKSVTSTLIGIAIDRHLIKSVDEKVATFFPEYADVFADPKKAQIRLRDLLTMTAGLEWDEWATPYSDPRNDHLRMILCDDPVRYVIDRPVVAAAGERFAYSSGIAITFGQILAKVSGRPADKFAEEHLFTPLGISDYYWSKLPGEIVQTAGGLHLRPRDMAKLGQLFLDGGTWHGKRIVSKTWVSQSTENHVPPAQIPAAANGDGYGYQWWLSSFAAGDRVVKSYSARGRGGQFIFVCPDQRLVATFTCAVDNPALFEPMQMLRRYVLPAAGALPDVANP